MTLPGYDWGKHACGACGRTHFEPYEAWCRAERERLYPEHFTRWTEEEHTARGSKVPWAVQENIWHHRDTWEAVIDGRMTAEQARTLLVNSEPLPTLEETRAWWPKRDDRRSRAGSGESQLAALKARYGTVKA